MKLGFGVSGKLRSGHRFFYTVEVLSEVLSRKNA